MPDSLEEQLTKEDKILTNTEKLCTSIDMMRKDYNKIIYALIAIMAANLGLKFAGTPLIVDISIYVTIFSGVFSSLIIAASWLHLHMYQKVFFPVLSTFTLFSGIAQVFLFRPDSDFNYTWFIFALNCFMIVVSVALTFGAYKVSPFIKSPKGKCSTEEAR